MMKLSQTPSEVARIAEKIKALQKACAAYEDVRASFDRETESARAIDVGERALRAWKASADASTDLTRTVHEIALGPGWERLRAGGSEVAARYNEMCAASEKAESAPSPSTEGKTEAHGRPLRGPPMEALPQPEVRGPPSPHNPQHHRQLLEAWSRLHAPQPGGVHPPPRPPRNR